MIATTVHCMLVCSSVTADDVIDYWLCRFAQKTTRNMFLAAPLFAYFLLRHVGMCST